jgi:hypothetical protein
LLLELYTVEACSFLARLGKRRGARLSIRSYFVSKLRFIFQHWQSKATGIANRKAKLNYNPEVS